MSRRIDGGRCLGRTSVDGDRHLRNVSSSVATVNCLRVWRTFSCIGHSYNFITLHYLTASASAVMLMLTCRVVMETQRWTQAPLAGQATLKVSWRYPFNLLPAHSTPWKARMRLSPRHVPGTLLAAAMVAAALLRGVAAQNAAPARSAETETLTTGSRSPEPTSSPFLSYSALFAVHLAAFCGDVDCTTVPAGRPTLLGPFPVTHAAQQDSMPFIQPVPTCICATWGFLAEGRHNH
jgi:hypothetical protein